jgi:DNA-binding XRE family transcriptional regulator
MADTHPHRLATANKLGEISPREELRAFLKELRQRIRPDACELGAHVRLPSRRGKPVTQEELAEAIGVSRAWYAMLESGATVRVSTRLLDRLSRALMLTIHERAVLFCLAIPELQQLAEGAWLENPLHNSAHAASTRA